MKTTVLRGLNADGVLFVLRLSIWQDAAERKNRSFSFCLKESIYPARCQLSTIA